MMLKRCLSGVSERSMRSKIESLHAARPKCFICGPIAKVPRILISKCAITYETTENNNPDDLVLTEPDVELLIEALDYWFENNKKSGRDVTLIRKYLVNIKSHMAKIRKGLL